jgi:hypothetical protein
MHFVYTAWFRNPQFLPDEQDHEWPACFVIEAPDGAGAKAWGDHLAADYARRTDQPFLSSSVEPLEGEEGPATDALPHVPYGHEATDEEIGW